MVFAFFINLLGFDFIGNGDGRRCQMLLAKLGTDKPDILSYYRVGISTRHRDNL